MYFSPINNQHTITMKQPFTPKQAIIAHIEANSLDVIRKITSHWKKFAVKMYYSEQGSTRNQVRDSFYTKHAFRCELNILMRKQYMHLTGATEAELIEVLKGIVSYISENTYYHPKYNTMYVDPETMDRAAEMIAQNTGLLLMNSLNQ